MSQVSKCRFGTFEAEQCKDQIITAIQEVFVVNNNSLHRRLLQDEFTFEQANTLSLRLETIEKESLVISNSQRASTCSMNINAMKYDQQ